MSGYYIYKHTSPSGKSYIGITNNYQKRCRQHKVNAQDFNYECIRFELAIRKWGWDNFEHTILEENLNLEESCRKESLYIKIYDSLSPNGYNLQTGGGHYCHSEETRLKMSLDKKGRPSPNKGKKFSEESKLKMSISAKNRKPISEETRLKISEGIKNSMTPERLLKKSILAKNRSPETLLKLSIAGKGKIISEEHKQILRRPRSEETRLKMTIARNSREPISEETRLKMSESAKKRGCNNAKKILDCWFFKST